MIAVKLAVIVVGAGALFSLFTPELDADLLLAVFAPKKSQPVLRGRWFADMPVTSPGTRYKFATLPR